MMIKRFPKKNIENEVVEAFFNIVGKPQNNESDNISEVWRNVFKKFDLSNNRDISDLEISEVRDLFENYFVNGLSDGACAGKAMENYLTKYKYLSREKKRLASLYLHTNPGIDKSYNRVGIELKLSNDQFKKIINQINDVPVSELLYTGQPWMNIFKGQEYLLELTDHYYFFDIVKRYLNNHELKPIFLGDGSGILSNIFLNSDLKISNSVFIDLQHFLLRQFIINYNKLHKVQNYIYAQDFQTSLVKSTGMTIINQDSFPEIPKHALNRYFSLITSGKVNRVISYNHLDLRGDHSDYRSMLLELLDEPKVRFESKLRNGYFIEIFEK